MIEEGERVFTSKVVALDRVLFSLVVARDGDHTIASVVAKEIEGNRVTKMSGELLEGDSK